MSVCVCLCMCVLCVCVRCVFVCVPQVGSQLSGTLAGLQAEREVLLRSVRDKDSELASLRQQSQLQQSSLDQHRQMAGMELGSLQAQLQQQVEMGRWMHGGREGWMEGWVSGSFSGKKAVFNRL